MTGRIHVGGLVGWVDQSKIDNCYSVAKVVGSNGVGGLVGSTHSPFDKLSSCYFAGTVSSNDAVEKSNFGSLVGDPNGLTEPIVNDCVYLDTSLKETSYGVTEFGKAVSNANMKQIATYQKGSSFLDDSNSEWDIVSDYDENHIWFIIEGKTYPLLSYYVLPSESGGNGFGSANIVSSVSEIPGFTDNTDNNPETPNENQEEDIKIVDGNSKLALVLFNRSRTHSHHRRNCLLFDSKKK